MKQKSNRKTEKLAEWQHRLSESDTAYKGLAGKMDHREALYSGKQHTLRPITAGDHRSDGTFKRAGHVRNIIFENIESEVSSEIPQPKVTPRRKEDEKLADTIEHFLRNELDRMPFEMINDLAERTVAIQGGAAFLIEWDNSKRTHATVGEVTVTLLHPKQLAPQPGIYTGIEDMDWIIVKIPTTKAAVKREYDIDVDEESEAEPDIRGTGGEDTAQDAVTKYIGFERNRNGGINRYVWVNDVELEDLENYQARRQPVCAKCGRVRPLPGQVISNRRNYPMMESPDDAERIEQIAAGRELSEQTAAAVMGAVQSEGVPPEGGPMGAGPSEGPMSGGPVNPLDVLEVDAEPADQGMEPEKYDGGPCPWCGSTEFTTEEQEFEQILLPMELMDGTRIEGMTPGYDDEGYPVMKPTLIPFYKPDMFPIVLQRNVSVYGQLLGNSDVDIIEDQQNTVNRMEQKIIDRIVKAGTRVTMPSTAELRLDTEDGEIWRVDNASDVAMIKPFEFKGDLEYELLYLSNVYEEARQILGITDSYQGRTDHTAQSGKAKEFAAAQSAGRLESKRTMKNAAYAALFEMIFKFWLAYGDEPRPVSYKDSKGESQYEEFNRYDFLRIDEDGQPYWNDQFLFSCDTSAPLANNREALWQETRQNLQTGAFGDPTQTETLILFWAKMEELHYPGAATTKAFLEDKLAREQAAMQQQQMMMQQQMMAQQQAAAVQQGQQRQVLQAVDEQARQDALNDVQNGQGAAQNGGANPSTG